ncbi:hypothetical protein PoB_003597500 [Plakobranchus ocellatus]|uniref:Uncharacterized protein n=1 Tax=Plakobranchus ocellatus TaxID=259542 RepID=A0AAV4AQ51_9GAST|nr:hypothetical protein PoB_003597500 [Plakobranchus ocellatus]
MAPVAGLEPMKKDYIRSQGGLAIHYATNAVLEVYGPLLIRYPNKCVLSIHNKRKIGGTVVSEPALRSAGTLLSRVRAPSPVPWSESLRSPFCGQAN